MKTLLPQKKWLLFLRLNRKRASLLRKWMVFWVKKTQDFRISFWGYLFLIFLPWFVLGIHFTKKLYQVDQMRKILVLWQKRTPDVFSSKDSPFQIATLQTIRFGEAGQIFYEKHKEFLPETILPLQSFSLAIDSKKTKIYDEVFMEHKLKEPIQISFSEILSLTTHVEGPQGRRNANFSHFSLKKKPLSPYYNVDFTILEKNS